MSWPSEPVRMERAKILWGTRFAISVRSTDGPTAAMVKLLVGRKPANQKGAMENLDLPDEIEEESPRSWSEWDLYCLRMDLSTMQFDFASWTISPKAPAPSSLSRADE